jgi:DNA-directed RNA polymerase subunit K/omega
MQGAPPLIRTKSRKPAAIAIREVEKDLIPYFMPGEIPELPTDEELEAVEESEE